MKSYKLLILLFIILFIYNSYSEDIKGIKNDNSEIVKNKIMVLYFNNVSKSDELEYLGKAIPSTTTITIQETILFISLAFVIILFYGFSPSMQLVA